VLSLSQDSGVSPINVALSGNALAQYPVPTISSQLPVGFVVGTKGPQTVTITGTNFFVETQVLWNGNPIPAQLVNSTTLKFQLADADMANMGDAVVWLRNPAPGGGTSATRR